MKRCTQCNEMKDETEYFRLNWTSDGVAYECKVCAKKRNRANYIKNRPARLEAANKEYWKNRERYILQRRARYWLHHDEEIARMRKKYKDKPEIYHAENKAFFKVKLKPFCEICGKPAKERHHPDYSKPLEVKHLCISCHRRIHTGRIVA